MKTEPGTAWPEFELCLIRAQALRAALAMRWGMSEAMVETLVKFKIDDTLPTGYLKPLNPTATLLLHELGLTPTTDKN